MMSNLQYLLTKLAEEGAEIAQMSLKNQHFGIDECQFKGGESNRQRLHGELNDLLGVIDILNEEENFGFTPDHNAIKAKKEKIKHYRNYSVSLGLVKKKWTKDDLCASVKDDSFAKSFGCGRNRHWPRGCVLVKLTDGERAFRTVDWAIEMVEKGLAECFVSYEEVFGDED